MKNIYLDHSATTKIDEKVLEKMTPFLKEDFGNPSSIHSLGQNANKAVSKARRKVADFLNCKTEEVIFTSGATESNNLAILGHIKSIQEKNSEKIHIITSKIEHPAVLECFKHLERDENVEVSYISVNKEGVLNLKELEKTIKENTTLISIMYVNNEIGSLQLIRQIGEIIKKEREERENKKNKTPLIFHTDAVQAVNFYTCDTEKLGVDMLSLSGHKVYGPKGVGVFYVKENIPISPIILGGKQEKGLRSGTLNTAGIVGISEALELAKQNRNLNFKKIKKLRDKFVEKIEKNIPEIIFNGNLENTCPSHANIIFKKVEGESVLLGLDYHGISVSTGSACASSSLKTSHVLSAIGIMQKDSHGSIRFSLGKENTEEEISKVAEVLPSVIERLRKISPDLDD